MVVENIELHVAVVENTELPMVVENIHLPMMIENTELPVVVEPLDKNLIWLINYEQELQVLVITDREVESHYSTIHSALLNTFMSHSYAILILEGYIMAIIKQSNYFYVFDSHARDFNGMPDPNGTAVVIKFTNVLDLEQFLYSLSTKLRVSLFEIVPICVTKTKVRPNRANEYRKRNQSEKIRLE